MDAKVKQELECYKRKYPRLEDKKFWREISKNEPLSKEFVDTFNNDLDWDMLSAFCQLDKEQIIKYKDRVNWAAISASYHLGEDTIRELQDYLDWKHLSLCQNVNNFSDAFIEEFKDRIDWGFGVAHNQSLRDYYMRKMREDVRKQS